MSQYQPFPGQPPTRKKRTGLVVLLVTVAVVIVVAAVITGVVLFGGAGRPSDTRTVAVVGIEPSTSQSGAPSGDPSSSESPNPTPSPDESVTVRTDELEAALPKEAAGYRLTRLGELLIYRDGGFDQINVMSMGSFTDPWQLASSFDESTFQEIGDRGLCGDLAGAQCFLATSEFGVLNLSSISASTDTMVQVAQAVVASVP